MFEPFSGDLNLSGPLIERLLHLESILEDLRFTEASLNRLRELTGTDQRLQRVEAFDVVQVALWNAATVAYARCFVAGVRHAAAEGLVPTDRREVHRELYGLRVQHLAHFGRDSNHERMSLTARFAISAVGTLDADLKTEGVKSTLPTSSVLPGYIEHVAAVRAEAQARWDATATAIEAAFAAMDHATLLVRLRRGDTIRLELPPA